MKRTRCIYSKRTGNVRNCVYMAFLRVERDSLYVRAGGVACALASDTETSRRGFRKARRDGDGDGDGCFVRFFRSQVKVTVTIQS